MKKIIEEYQCLGCVSGCSPDDGCFEKADGLSVSCKKHVAGTILSGVGSFFLGMPKGFNRLGFQKKFQIEIYKTQKEQQTQWGYDEFNVAVWKHQNKKGHILVRGYMPRLNMGFIHIILKGDYKLIDAHEITNKDMDEMD